MKCSLLFLVLMAYMVVAAFFYGKFTTESWYRGIRGWDPRGPLLDLLLAVAWPVCLFLGR